MGLPSVLLRTACPNCGRRLRFSALVDVPRERYERVCPGCGTSWVIVREELRARSTEGVRLDKLEWEAST